MPNYKHIKNLLRNGIEATSKQKAQLRFYKDDVDKLLQKAMLSHNNLQYPNGETLQLLVGNESKGNKILETLERLNITKTEKECTDPKIIFDDDWCFADAGRTGPIHTRATMHSCSNPYNNTQVNDQSLLLKTLENDCFNYKALSTKDDAITVVAVLGAACVSALGIFCCLRSRRNRQHQLQHNSENNLQERLSLNHI